MPLTILVADDSATMRNILEMTFAGEDTRVVTVGSGDQAVAKAREVRPDIVLADVTMEMNGYEVARAFKSDPGLASIPVVVMASQQSPFDEAKARESGVDDHLIKPFDTQSVIDRINRIAASGAARPAAAAAPRPAAAAPPAPPAPPAARPPAPPMAASPVVPVAAKPAAAPAAPPASAPGSAQALHPPRTTATLGGVPPPAAAAAARPAAPAPAAARPATSAAVASATSAMSDKLGGLGLTPEQADAVMKLSREVIERVVWEVVPDLAETIIREEIQRLTSE